MRQCPHHGIPKHEIDHIFYDGLGVPDRYLLNGTSGGTFMRKYEDEAIELIELVAENSHHHAAKPFGGQISPSKGGMLDAKGVETGMLLDKIKKLTKAQNLIMDLHKIRLGSEGLALIAPTDASQCLHCSSFEHVKLDCPLMPIQGPYPYRKNPKTYQQAARSHYQTQGYSNNSYYNRLYAQ